jgi:hypothetical protein
MTHVARITWKAFCCLAAAFFLVAPARAENSPRVETHNLAGKVEITVGGKPFATYVYADPKITRPYFAHVRAPNGTQVTRNHPPVPGQDKMDHPEFHPGIWMAFGDISSNDYWRLKAPVEHVEFVTDSKDDTFAVRNRYVSAADPGEVMCEELCRFRIVPALHGNLLMWDSEFTGTREFAFGDQEEMGLGVRVATPLRVEAGDGSLPPGNGTMIDSEGRKNGAEIGGNSADWCDYSGSINGQHIGMTIFCHPENFRPSWFHARDYGFLAANAFGRAAFRKGAPSKIVVKPGESLRLRYGILLYSCPQDSNPDLKSAYEEYVQLASNSE